MISFTLPIRTTNPLNCSQGISRGAMLSRARVRKSQRASARLMLTAHLNAWPLARTPPWAVTITRIAPSAGLDDDALPASSKSVRDGIADALGLASDRDPRITWAYSQRRGPAGYYGVEIRLVESPVTAGSS
jgi:hypothetical protein